MLTYRLLYLSPPRQPRLPLRLLPQHLLRRLSQLAIILAAALLMACGPLENNVDTGTAAQILHLGNATEPEGLDPHIATGVSEHNIFAALLEGLVTEDPKTLAAEPGVAQRWEISADGRRYTFFLNPAAKWSNGDELIAEDFVYSWQRLLMPDLGAEYAYQLFMVNNAERFNRGKISDFSQVGIKALDKHTLVIELNAATPYFLSLLTHYSTFPVHRPTIEAFGTIDDRDSRWTRAGNFVGNGPFILTEWALNRIIRVQKNPFYWDAQQVRLNEIRFYPIENNVTEERMFRAKTLHATYEAPEEKIAVYQREKPHLLKISAYLGTYFYRFNITRAPLDNVKVRRALSMSIDRQKIVDAITKGGQIPAYNLTPPGTLGFTAHAKIPFDIAQAKQLLAEAGYPDGKGFPKFEILYNTDDKHRKIAVAIQQMWKQALGIDVGIYNQDWKSYLADVDHLNYSISRNSWIGDYVDPNTFLDLFVSGGGNNNTGFSNAEYDLMIRQAAAATDTASRYRYFQRAEEILVEHSPIMPIFTYTNVIFRYPEVKGWYDNILNHHPYKYVYLEKTP